MAVRGHPFPEPFETFDGFSLLLGGQTGVKRRHLFDHGRGNLQHPCLVALNELNEFVLVQFLTLDLAKQLIKHCLLVLTEFLSGAQHFVLDLTELDLLLVLEIQMVGQVVKFVRNSLFR